MSESSGQRAVPGRAACRHSDSCTVTLGLGLLVLLIYFVDAVNIYFLKEPVYIAGNVVRGQHFVFSHSAFRSKVL